MGTLTNMGIFANGRAVEYLLTKMFSDPLDEVKGLAKQMIKEVKPFIGNFVERLETEKGEKYIAYLQTHENNCKELTVKYIKQTSAKTAKKKVVLVDYDKEAEAKIVASILFPYSHTSYEQILKKTKKFSAKKLQTIIETYVKERQGRWHKVGKAFEEIYYTFEIVSDNGAYKDLERHRICSQYRQYFTTQLGYEVPKDITDAGFCKKYTKAMDLAGKTFDRINKQFPEQA
ncbi:MAG: thymidylate synthase complementing protein ThyX, partial [uncultured bacterium]